MTEMVSGAGLSPECHCFQVPGSYGLWASSIPSLSLGSPNSLGSHHLPPVYKEERVKEPEDNTVLPHCPGTARALEDT